MNCHRCDYDLTGLPQQHRCPECGLAYDDSVRTWKPADHWVFLASPALLLFQQLMGFINPTISFSSFRWPLLLTATAVCSWSLIHGISRWRLGYKLVLAPEGVLVRDERKDYCFPFESIKRLDVEPKPGYFRNVVRVKIMPVKGASCDLSRFLTTNAKVREFEREFEQALLRLRSRCTTAAS